MIHELGQEWPKAIYRDGGSEMLWGKPIETSAVSSREEEVEALAKGWRLHPLDEPQTAEMIDDVQRPRGGRPPKAKAEE